MSNDNNSNNLSPPPETSEKSSLPSSESTEEQLNHDVIEGIVEQLVEQFPDLRREAAMEVVCRQFSGPIPYSGEMAAYKEVREDLPDRIMAMAESQQQFSNSHQRELVNQVMSLRFRGQLFGFLIGCLGLVCSTIAALNGAEVFGGALGIGSIVALVSVFVIGRRGSDKDDDDED